MKLLKLMYYFNDLCIIVMTCMDKCNVKLIKIDTKFVFVIHRLSGWKRFYIIRRVGVLYINTVLYFKMA